MNTRFAIAVVGALCAAGQAGAQDDVRVYSSAADAVSVTIYRDDIALITETRTVTLPDSAVTLVIEGVADTMLAQSAVLADIDRALVESNLDFDPLTPASLLQRAVGEQVILTRTDPASGRVTRTLATIISAGNGVVLDVEGGLEALYCAGLPERLEFARLPDGLRGRPQLSVQLDGGEAASRTFTVSYLAHGFSWSADYVARLNARGDGMALSGWATLTNSSSSTLEQIDLQLVAGALNILPDTDGGSRAGSQTASDDATASTARLRECYTFATVQAAQLASQDPNTVRGRTMFVGASGITEITVTGARIVRREELGDYYLYRVPWQTDLPARQTKQVLFLDEPDVRIDRYYSLFLQTLTDIRPAEPNIPDVVIAWQNTRSQGAGQPLAKGRMRFFEPWGDRVVFAGEAEIGDTPADVPVELTIGRALNLTLEQAMTISSARTAGDRERTTIENTFRIINNKAAAADIEIRHHVQPPLVNAGLEDSSHPMQRKHGDFAWRFVAQPGEETLRYSLSAERIVR